MLRNITKQQMSVREMIKESEGTWIHPLEQQADQRRERFRWLKVTDEITPLLEIGDQR